MKKPQPLLHKPASLRPVGRVGGGKVREGLEKKEQEALEEKAAREARDMERRLNESMKQVHGKLEVESEADFFVCLVFQSGAQREAFLRALQWDTRRNGDLYLDGRILARQLDIELPKEPDWKEAKTKHAFASFAMKPPAG